MNIKIIKDCHDLDSCVVPSGTVIQECEDLGDSYKGLWSYMCGTYYVTVNKEFCELFEGWPKPLRLSTRKNK